MNITHRIVVKIGTNVLAEKDGTISEHVLKHIVHDLSVLHRQGVEIVLVTSGAVGAGLQHSTITERDPMIKKQLLAAIGQPYLMQSYVSLFLKEKITVAQALLTRDDFLDRRRYDFIRRTLLGLLQHRVLPIINENDVIAIDELSFSDNDALAAMTAATIEADRFILLTNIDGLYTKDPEQHTDAKRLDRVEHADRALLDFCSRRTSPLGSGGMLSKIRAAILATNAGITTYVANGRKKDILLSLIRTGKGGTTFLPQEKKHLTPKERWLLIGASSGGRLTIDAGAEAAVRKGKSLLAVGVASVQGTFEHDDVVEVVSLGGVPLGYGKVYYGSKELEESRSSKKRLTHELIHRDYFVSLNQLH